MHETGHSSQGVSPFIELKNQICDIKIEPSKSIDSVLEEGEKMKKTERKKSKFKDEILLLISSPVQT